MRRSAFFALILLTGGGFLFNRVFEIEGLDQLSLKRRDPVAVDASSPGSQPSSPRAVETGESIKIATFNIQVFGTSKMGKRDVVGRLLQIVRNFDVVAIQELRSKDDTIVAQFVDALNATGLRYDYAVGPRLGRSSSKEQYIYLFNTDTIEIDRTALETISDPDDLLHREPYVGWFRARGPEPERAFTFRLINIHTDPDEVKTEVNALDDVYRAVQSDGRNEDDVILLGDLNANDRQLGELGEISGITWVVRGEPTNTRETKSYDNILFDARATKEYLGRYGVYDMVSELNITREEALRISDHQPVWAEFSVYEGGPHGSLAERDAETATR